MKPLTNTEKDRLLGIFRHQQDLGYTICILIIGYHQGMIYRKIGNEFDTFYNNRRAKVAVPKFHKVLSMEVFGVLNYIILNLNYLI